MKVLSVAQSIALNAFLSEYPEGMPFRQVLSGVANCSDEIWVADRYASIVPDDLISDIDDLAKEIQKAIDEELAA